MAPEPADTRPPRNGPMLRHRSPAYNCGSIEGAVRGGSTVVAAAKTATRLVNVLREMSAGIMLRTCWRRMIGESPECASVDTSLQQPYSQASAQAELRPGRTRIAAPPTGE